MARTQNLSEYLTDIATAIKTKKGDETPINASKFDEEIANLPTGEDIYEYWQEGYYGVSSILTYPIVRFIKKIPPINTSGVSNMGNAFQYFENISEIPEINTSRVTKMSYMFSQCYNLKRIPLLDTTNVTDMSYMFRDCKEIEQINLTNTSKVTNMTQIFSGCEKLVNLNINDFNTANVTQISYGFSSCKELTNIPLLDFSKMIQVSAMFFIPEGAKITELGGFKDLGKAYKTTSSANYGSYTLDLHYCTNLTHDSIMNVINNLYDIATLGVQTQKLQLGELVSLVTAEEINIAVEKGFSVS